MLNKHFLYFVFFFLLPLWATFEQAGLFFGRGGRGGAALERFLFECQAPSLIIRLPPRPFQGNTLHLRRSSDTGFSGLTAASTQQNACSSAPQQLFNHPNYPGSAQRRVFSSPLSLLLDSTNLLHPPLLSLLPCPPTRGGELCSPGCCQDSLHENASNH